MTPLSPRTLTLALALACAGAQAADHRQPHGVFAATAQSAANTEHRLRTFALGQGLAIARGANAQHQGWSNSGYVLSTAVNNAPQWSSPAPLVPSPIAEDDTSQQGDTIASLLAQSPWRDVDRGAAQGLAVSGADTRNGQWQYSLDGGATWQSLSGVSEEAALLLAAEARLRLLPAADYYGSDTGALTVRAWDQSRGENGGLASLAQSGATSAFSRDSATIRGLEVLAVNDAPAAAALALSVTEDQTLSASLSGRDVDSASLRFELTSSPTRGSVELLDAASGTFRYTPAANQTGADNFRYRLSDGALNSAEATVSLYINPVNDAPTLAAIPDQATEQGMAIRGISLVAADVDSLGSELTFSVSADNSALLPAGAATIGGSGYTRSLNLLPNAGAYGQSIVTVAVSDGQASSSQRFLLSVAERIELTPLAVADTSGSAFTSQRRLSAGGSLALQASGGSGAYSATIESQPAGAAARLEDNGNGAYALIAPDSGAFAGTYQVRLSDQQTGESVLISVYVPLQLTVEPYSLAAGESGEMVVRGAAAGDRLSLSVLDSSGATDASARLASIGAEAIAEANAADANPARASFRATAAQVFGAFRLQATDTSQTGLQAVRSDLIQSVPQQRYCGQVIDPLGVVAGAQVSVDSGETTYSTQSGTDGRFELNLPQLAYGDYTLKVSAEGHIPANLAAAAYQGACTERPTLTLALAEGRISGTLVGLEADGRAELNASAEARLDGPFEVDAGGTQADAFTLYLSREAHYDKLTAQARGYLSATATNGGIGFALAGGDISEVVLTLERPRRYLSQTSRSDEALQGARLSAAAESDGPVITFLDQEGESLCGYSADAITPLGQRRQPIAQWCEDGALSVRFSEDEVMRVVLYYASGSVAFVTDYQPLETERRDSARRGAESAVVSAFGGFDEQFGVDHGRVRVRLAADGIDPAYAARVSLAVVEVEALATKAEDKARASFGQVTDVALSLLDSDGLPLPVDAEHAGEVLKSLSISLPFDTTRVRPEDFAAGRVRIYQAEDLHAFERGEVSPIDPDAIERVDLLEGRVTFRVNHLSVFGLSGNAVPLAFDQSLTLVARARVSGQLEASDADADTLTYELVEAPRYGSLSLEAATGAFIYQGSADNSVVDSFRFRVSDGLEYSNEAVVSVQATAEPQSVPGQGGGGGGGALGLGVLVLLGLGLAGRRGRWLGALLLLAGQAHGQWYLGAGVGPSHTPANAHAMAGQLGTVVAGSQVAVVESEESDIGWQLLGGYRWGAWALELGYVDLGRVDSTFSVSGLPVAAHRAVIAEHHPLLPKGPTLAGVGYWEVGRGVELYAKAGALAWEGEVAVKLPGGALEATRDGSAALLGLGVELREGDSPWRLRLGIDGFRVEEEWVSLTSGSVVFGF